jgi:hypothetical protein
MSFSQQSRSDLAAAEAEAKRKELGERSVNSRNRSAADWTKPSRGVIARFRGWAQRALAR